MRRLGKHQEEDQNIDISPLIDVVFILLIFFMVSTTFVKETQLELQRPSAQSASQASAKALRVSIDRYGKLFVGDQPVSDWMLQGRLREQLRQTTEQTILVVADRLTSTERLVEVVDQCRLAGAKDVAVVTDKEAGGTG